MRPWDDLQYGREQVVGDVGRRRGNDRSGLWEPDDEEWDFEGTSGAASSAITEQIASTAKDLAPALAALGEGEGKVVDFDTNTWEIEAKDRSAASILPGEDPDEPQRGWSGSEGDQPEIVEAIPAKSEPSELEAKLGEEHQGTGASGSGSSTDPKVAVKEESAAGYPMDVEEDPPAPASSSGDLPKAGIEVEAKPEKSEILEEEPRRRKVLRFGSAHIKLLRAVADADASNWNSLQKCLREHGGATPGQKTALVERLEDPPGGESCWRPTGPWRTPEKRHWDLGAWGAVQGRAQRGDGAARAVQSCGPQIQPALVEPEPFQRGPCRGDGSVASQAHATVQRKGR